MNFTDGLVGKQKVGDKKVPHMIEGESPARFSAALIHHHVVHIIFVIILYWSVGEMKHTCSKVRRDAQKVSRLSMAGV